MPLNGQRYPSRIDLQVRTFSCRGGHTLVDQAAWEELRQADHAT